MVTAKWASRVLLENIRATNDIYGKALNALLWNRYNVQMATSTLYRVRARALIEIHGGFDESYAFFPGYCEMIRRTNPGSYATCVWNPATHVDRPLAFVTIFISFKPYGNNELFPFAWGIVSTEDSDTWSFFVHHLRNLLRATGRGDNWCITQIGKRYTSGIEAALDKVWPDVDRRYCTKHLASNWKKAFPGPLILSLFWKACGAYSEFTFKKAMEQMDKVGKGGKLWLAKLGEQSRWTKHKFNTATKCDSNKSNFVESFNATLGIDRCKPVLTLLEGIRRNTMVRLATRRQKCEEWSRTDICPNIVQRVHKLCQNSKTCHSYLSSAGEFEVFEGKSYLAVSLNKKTCACGQWQISGIPCRHGMRAILDSKLDPHAFVDEWFSVKRYKAAYANGIKSIPDAQKWPEFNVPKIMPPELKRGIGRPCRNRKKDDTEERKGKRAKTVRCSKCQDYVHNAQTCKGGATAKQKWGGKKKNTKKDASSQATNVQLNPSPPRNTRQSARLVASQPQPSIVARWGAICNFASQPRKVQ
ncbi:uncharacterized protein LOC110717641 [Chenopodium quinoa]|uniref:uncharacterized protein LOC110717641 n=1 Tax=Chenopodium quinoa TaxID=63459 RepID=UPI000B778973|nr:uncharacterized protein LOC110717641 [Chenopodium quinoa]